MITSETKFSPMEVAILITISNDNQHSLTNFTKDAATLEEFRKARNRLEDLDLISFNGPYLTVKGANLFKGANL